MKLACLFSGGKDSNYALYKASEKHEISCLISMKSENKESYMFQTPGNDFISLQAKALEIPLIHYDTKGEKEEELIDLRKAIEKAKDEFGIEGIVTGAIKSAYQSSRIQKICHELDLYCFNPLWQIDEETFMKELIEKKFKVMIIGVFSYPLTEKYLGKILDEKLLDKFIELNKKFGLSIAGEGGELETFILDSPMFKKEITITQEKKIMDSENAGILQIENVEVKEK